MSFVSKIYISVVVISFSIIGAMLCLFEHVSQTYLWIIIGLLFSIGLVLLYLGLKEIESRLTPTVYLFPIENDNDEEITLTLDDDDEDEDKQ